LTRQRTTIGLAIGWLTEVQSAVNQYQQQFQQDIINLALVVIFIFFFPIGFGSGLSHYKIPAHRQALPLGATLTDSATINELRNP
jgi:hypothetical protein